MQIKGKQIANSSVKQNNLNVTTDSIITVSAVTNSEYVNTSSVNKVEQITYATLNLGMVANNATVGDLACDIHVIEFPISNIMVRVNNVYVTVGESADCYFSPDAGITKRVGGTALKGDYLYWNSTRFNLDTTDEIDFVYITASDAVELAGGTTVTLDPYYPALNVKYTGNSGTTMTVIIDGVSFTVGNVSGSFVWDLGGVNEHTFTTVGEKIIQLVNTIDYTIWYDGLGSLLFSIRLGNFSPVTVFNIGVGFDALAQCVINDNNQYLVGGNFNYYNKPFTVRVVSVNNNGDVNNSINFGTGFNNTVYSIIQDSNGKYIIGGNFSAYNGVNQNRIYRLNQDGSIDSTFAVGAAGFNATVYSIIQDSNGKYVIGGLFTSYKGLTQNYICRLNQDGSLDSTFVVDTGFNGEIRTIIQDINGKYIVGGGFTTYKGLTQNRIIRLNQDGSLDSTFVVGTGFNNYVYSLIQDTNGKYIIGGFFTTYKGLTQNRIIRLNQDGSLDSTFAVGTGFNTYVYSIIQDTNEKYVIGGAITTYKGVSQYRICRLEQNGDLDSTFNIGTGFNGEIRSIIQDSNGKYVIGGDYTTYKGVSQNRICRLEQNGDLDSTFNIGIGFNFIVYNIIQNPIGIYIIGGSFSTYKNPISRLIRLNNDGTVDNSFNIGTGFNSDVYCVMKDSNGKYMIGGNFTTYKGVIRNYICRLNQDGSLDTTFAPTGTGLSSLVLSITEDVNNKYVICGSFTQYNGVSQNRIARLNQNGTLDSSFVIGTGFNSDVWSLVIDSNGKYVVGGHYTTYKGLSQNRISRLNTDGSLDTTFVVGSGINNRIHKVVQDSNGKYIIVGYFTTYNGLVQNYIARIEQDGTLDTTFNIGTGFSSYTQSIILESNGKYFVIGGFALYNGTSVKHLCRLNQDGSLDNTFNTGTSFQVNAPYTAILDSNNKYLVVGNFISYKGVSSNYIIRINYDGTTNTSII